MHNCLCITEVLENIFGHLGTNYVGGPPLSSLAAVARTCKTFTDPALDVLWAEQSNLENLLKCLPSSCWKEIEFGRPSEPPLTTIKILRRLEADDWVHVSKYCHRVRSLFFYSWGDRAPHAELFAEIERSLPTGLFPNLRKLEWWPTEISLSAEVFIRCLRLLVGPQLASLRLQLGTFKSASEIALLLTIDMALPALRYLDISVGNDAAGRSAWYPTFSAMALKLSTPLEELELPTIDMAALRHLSVLPRLARMTLYAPKVGDIGTSVAMIPATSFPFPALRYLRLAKTTIGFGLDMIASVENWALESLTIGLQSPERREMTGLLYTAIASHFSASCLDYLRIGHPSDGREVSDPPEDTRADYAVTGEILRPLFCFGNITEVILKPPAGFLLDDSILSELARAWPNIVTLRLGSGSSVQVHPIATLNALRFFAMHCKRLGDLTLAIDASTVPDFSVYRQLRASQNTLRRLNVEISPIGDPVAVARFVSGHFPAIDSVDTFRSWRWGQRVRYRIRRYEEGEESDDEDQEPHEEDEEHKYHKHWKDVEKMLPLCKAVRAEERYWAGVESE
ncbi:hypothetical protein C8F01DRAFT_1058566 [Mycena amicta]|nr:hypothetical protein C8F01DRAFT_1058566 [Mycena amicta]